LRVWISITRRNVRRREDEPGKKKVNGFAALTVLEGESEKRP
jgi:hypothetical protein